jgi:hypothetical protein
MDVHTLQAELDRLDDGVLKQGAHQPGSRAFCALEFDAVVRGRAHSDAPLTLPDLRPLNDALWSSDVVRTHHLLPVMAAYWEWAEWSEEKRQRVMGRVVVLTVQRVIAGLPYLSPEIVMRCQQATTLETAGAAAYAAARAAHAAADAAAYAAYAAADAAADAAANAAARAAAYAAADAAAYAANIAAYAAARAAVRAAADAAANAAANAADAAANAARAAVDAAADAAAGDSVLITACALWVEAAAESAA